MGQSRELHRRSIRLPDFDYARPGWYFLTICCDDRFIFGGGSCRRGADGPFGFVRSKACINSRLGAMVAEEWVRLAERFPWAKPADSVVMPDHFHGLIYLNHRDDAGEGGSDAVGRSVPHLVQAFKSTTTWRAKRESLTDLVTRRGARLWQRNYYESVVRDGRHLAAVRKYIANNPVHMMRGSDPGTHGEWGWDPGAHAERGVDADAYGHFGWDPGM